MSKLAWARRVTAAAVMALFAIGLLGVFHASESPWLYWIERIQFVPALLGVCNGKAWAGVVLASLAAMTLLFGRVYCSWLCPLGVMQDAVNRLARRSPQKLKGPQFRHTPHHLACRVIFASLAFGPLAIGSVWVLGWLDPYTIATRFGAALIQPLGNSLMGWEADWGRYAPVLLAAAFLGMLLPLAFAWFKGRLYCNTICPVGALLGLLSRTAPFAPHIDSSRCGRCAGCMRACKAHAIDLKTMSVDSTRCVGCYDCLAACRNSAMTLRFHNPFRRQGSSGKKTSRPKTVQTVPETPSRRAFIGMGLAAAATAALPEWKTASPDDNPAVLGGNAAAGAIPPGGGSVERFLDRCTGCGLCISACPTHVLRPALLVHGVRGMMKPWLDYSRAFCRYDCHACSDICPEGALKSMDLLQKQHTQIALADYLQKNCNVWNTGHECARCADACPTRALTAEPVLVPFIQPEKCAGCRKCSRVCPHGAISMVEAPGRVRANGKPRPLAVVDRSRCIGCGACFHTCQKHGAIAARESRAPRFEPQLCIGCGACVQACPAEPKAMAVTPRAVHLTAEDAEEEPEVEWVES